LKVARFCAQANARFSFADKCELLSRLPFDRTIFSKLAKIGADSRLHEPEIQNLLPANYSLVYVLARLDDQQLEAAIVENIIHPKAKRAEVVKWIRSRRVAELGASEIRPNWNELHFTSLRAAWHKAHELRRLWLSAPASVRQRFVIDVLEMRCAP